MRVLWSKANRPAGPAPDGDFVQDLPGKLLLKGKFDRSLAIVAGHNSNEAGKYTAPITTSDEFTTIMDLYFPQMTKQVRKYLTRSLFPPVYDGSYPWTTPFERLAVALSELTFSCATDWLGRAYHGQTHNYLFSVPPGNHTLDVPYYLYNGPVATVLNDTLAVTMQRYLTSFVEDGTPGRHGLPEWPLYGSDAEVINWNQTFINTTIDVQTANGRCRWWQKALYGNDYTLYSRS